MEITPNTIPDELRQIERSMQGEPPTESLDQLVERKRRELGIPEPRNEQCPTST